MSRRDVLTSEVRTTFDYGDVETCAKKTFDLVMAHLDCEQVRWNDGYNRARILREAVETVAGY